MTQTVSPQQGTVPDPFVDEIVARIEGVLPSERPAALHEPSFGAAERDSVLRTLETGWVSTSGGAVEEFEAALAAYTGAEHVVCTVNGTAALHLALLVAGVVPGAEVIVPSLTFIATANAVAHCGAVPHFADSDSETFGLCPESLHRHLSDISTTRNGALYNKKTDRPIKAIVCTHIFGRPAKIQKRKMVADSFGIPLIEDAAESLGSKVGSVHTGRFGSVSTLSFNGNKIVTSGGGGAVMTDDPTLGARVRRLATTSRVPHPWRWTHDEVAFNYRLPSLNAALGVAQLARMPDYLAAKTILLERYTEAFAGLNKIEIVQPTGSGQDNNWLISLRLRPPSIASRDAILEALIAKGIHARPVWELMHTLPMYETAPRAETLGMAESLIASLITLPSSPKLVAGNHG